MTPLKTPSSHVTKTKLVCLTVYGRSYYYAEFLFYSPTDQGNRKHPNAGHQSTSGTKRKIEDSKQSFEIVDNGPGVDSGVEEQPLK